MRALLVIALLATAGRADPDEGEEGGVPELDLTSKLEAAFGLAITDEKGLTHLEDLECTPSGDCHARDVHRFVAVQSAGRESIRLARALASIDVQRFDRSRVAAFSVDCRGENCSVVLRRGDDLLARGPFTTNLVTCSASRCVAACVGDCEANLEHLDDRAFIAEIARRADGLNAVVTCPRWDAHGVGVTGCQVTPVESPWSALVRPGSRWQVGDVTGESRDVHAVGAATVARLDWSDSGDSGRPPAIAVTDDGVWFLAAGATDDDVRAAMKTPPTHPPLPLEGAEHGDDGWMFCVGDGEVRTCYAPGKGPVAIENDGGD